MEELHSGEVSQAVSTRRVDLALLLDNVTGMPSALGMTDGYVNSPTNGKSRSQEMNVETEAGYMNEEATIAEGTMNMINNQDSNQNTRQADEKDLLSHTFYHS